MKKDDGKWVTLKITVDRKMNILSDEYIESNREVNMDQVAKLLAEKYIRLHNKK